MKKQMVSSWSAPEQELSCPVCQDIFKDPVLLSCSHSFCSACVQQWWRTKRILQCPVCKSESATNKPPRNLVLKNLCEVFLLERNSEDVCSVHGEKLKLFCLNHRKPVCVICRESDEHGNHRFRPVDEAAANYRRALETYLKPLHEKVNGFNLVKSNWYLIEEEIRSQVQHAEKVIKKEIKMLHEFLQEEEAARIAAVKKEGELKRQQMKDMITALTLEISTLENTINMIDDKVKGDDLSVLLCFDDLVKDAQDPLPADPQQVTEPLVDVAKHVGNLAFNVWYKMKDKVSFTPVILDPNSAHEELHLSEDLTSVKCGEARLLARTRERMEYHRSVLGSEGYSSGTHTWEVCVGNNQVWALGVVAKSAQRNKDILSGLWMLRFCNGKFTAFSPSCAGTVLPQQEQLWRVRIYLDFNKGTLSFYNRHTLVHTFRHAFTGKLFPYINTWSELPVKIVPLQFQIYGDN